MDEHLDHCLDAIRQELQCRAEVSLTTYEWLPDLPIPWAKLSYEHTCVDFDVSFLFSLLFKSALVPFGN
jgi:hypothetical protein